MYITTLFVGQRGELLLDNARGSNAYMELLVKYADYIFPNCSVYLCPDDVAAIRNNAGLFEKMVRIFSLVNTS